jgi:hypothetical protein
VRVTLPNGVVDRIEGFATMVKQDVGLECLEKKDAAN